jgi:hypothetical protein
VLSPAAVAVRPHDLAPAVAAAPLRPPGGQHGASTAPLTRVGGQGGEEAVDAHQVGQALAVGNLQRPVTAVAEPAHVGVLFGGQHASAGGTEHVVIWRGALPVAGVGTEAGQDTGVGELLEAVFGAVQGVEEHLGQLVGGEHAVLVDQPEDRAVAVGEAPGEAGKLVGQAP